MPTEIKTTDFAALERIAKSNGYWHYIKPFADESKRLCAWMHYIEGNFRDGRECAAEALRGDAPPEGFAP